MSFPLGRSLRNAGFGLLIAAAPVSLLVQPVLAQMPGMAMPGMPGVPGIPAEPIELTDELVTNLIASYPAFLETSRTLEQRYNVPGNDEPAAGFAALMAYGDAMGELDGIATTNGFPDFSTWLQTFVTVMTTMAFAAPDMTEQERAMMRQFMPPTMIPTDANIAIVQAHYAEIAALVDDEG